MTTFPDWSDLGNVSPTVRTSWEGEIAIRAERREYFTGEVFNQKVPTESGLEEDKVELYPVGINLVKMLCISQADTLFGEWDEDIVTFEPRRDAEVDESEKAASRIARDILNDSQAETLLWELALDGNIYGGGVMKIAVSAGGVKWTRVPIDAFFPIWDPEDVDRLLEVYIVYDLTRDQAKARYGYEAPSGQDLVQRVEHWTQRTYTNKLDGRPIQAYSGINPWGFIPFEYVPRIRTTHWWGDSLTEDVQRAQDELNMRIADLGEAINYNSHPTRWGYNLPKRFNADNYPLGPNILWDLGRVLGQSPEPKVGVLETKDPVPRGTFDYIRFLYDWGRTSVGAPPVAFGEDSDGSQRSGITLEVRMQPLIRAVRRQRSYFSAFLRRAMYKSTVMLVKKDLDRIPKMGLRRLGDGAVVPRFAPIMPRDQAKLVDEVVKRMSTTPPSISLESAVKKLGEGTAEADRVEEMLLNENLYIREKQGETAGMNSGTGNVPTS